jgi:hypothetical protein
MHHAVAGASSTRNTPQLITVALSSSSSSSSTGGGGGGGGGVSTSCGVGRSSFVRFFCLCKRLYPTPAQV